MGIALATSDTNKTKRIVWFSSSDVEYTLYIMYNACVYTMYIAVSAVRRLRGMLWHQIDCVNISFFPCQTEIENLLFNNWIMENKLM